VGARRPFFTTDDSVEDIELVRRRLGVRRIVLYGVSYGTKVTLAYALAHPDRVERLVVDSAFEPEGPDPFYRDTLEAIPRALRQLCVRGCSGDVGRDLEALAARLGRGPLRGYVVDRDGRRRRASVGQFDLFALLLAGDSDPSLRGGTPAVMRSALRGDPLPLIRLARRARIVEGEPPPPRELSVGLYATTTCEEAPLPWQRSASVEERRRQAQAAVRALPEEVLRPFGAGLALASDVISLCVRWPQGPEPRPLAPGPFPRVPALVLAADQDLRTPREGAVKVAARLPRARLVTVRDAGHAVLFSDFTGCSARALREFFANRRVRSRCSRGAGVFVPDPHVPASLADLMPARGASGRRGRTLRAVSLTLADVLAGVGTSPRGGGLRGGRYSSRVGGLERLGDEDLSGVESEEEALELLDELAESAYLDVRLENVQLIRGVRVSGRLRLGLERPRGLVRVSGGAAAPGRLRVGGSGERMVLAGRLGGRRVRGLGDLGPAGADGWVARRAAARPRPVSP
jgi:pimeloyl-ACP methyl ester carboxylesterase